eukprot:4366842-Prymnesium_polylepis.1
MEPTRPRSVGWCRGVLLRQAPEHALRKEGDPKHRRGRPDSRWRRRRRPDELRAGERIGVG